MAKSRLLERAEQRNHTKDKGKRFPTYKADQRVLVREHKLSSAMDKEIHTFFLLYRGPYTIIEVNQNNTLTIADHQGKHTIQNLKNVKLYVPPDPRKDEGHKEEIQSN